MQIFQGWAMRFPDLSATYAFRNAGPERRPICRIKISEDAALICSVTGIVATVDQRDHMNVSLNAKGDDYDTHTLK